MGLLGNFRSACAFQVFCVFLHAYATKIINNIRIDRDRHVDTHSDSHVWLFMSVGVALSHSARSSRRQGHVFKIHFQLRKIPIAPVPRVQPPAQSTQPPHPLNRPHIHTIRSASYPPVHVRQKWESTIALFNLLARHTHYIIGLAPKSIPNIKIHMHAHEDTVYLLCFIYPY